MRHVVQVGHVTGGVGREMVIFEKKPDLTLESEVTPRPAAFCKLIGRHAEQLMCERIRSSRCMCHI